MWKNVGEVWESVLRCRGSSLKRGVERWGCEKMWGRCEKVCCRCGGKVWRGGKIWGRCGKVFCGVTESEKRCVGKSEKRCLKVYWGAGEVT